MKANEENIYVVNGFQFENIKDYEDALNEKKGIKYLEKNINLNDTAKVLQLYNSLLEKNMFHTPIGLEYMRRLRSTLVKSKGVDGEIPYVKVAAYVGQQDDVDVGAGSGTTAGRTSGESVKVKELEKKCDKYKDGRRNSIILNIILILAIIAMIVIARTATAPNIINYERVIIDKYSSWKEELSDKEKELKQWEKELEQREQEADET